MQIYEIENAERFDTTGIISHRVVMPWKERKKYSYRSVRVAMVWRPSPEVPSYIVCGGCEIEDKFSPTEKQIIRIIADEAIEEFSPEVLYNRVTDLYVSMLADSLYLDLKNVDLVTSFFQFLDRRNLRLIGAQDIPFADAAFRFGTMRDYNKSGSLLIDRESSLYKDIQLLSEEHLKNPHEVEKTFPGLNALSILVSGFEKFKPIRPLKFGKEFFGGKLDGWML